MVKPRVLVSSTCQDLHHIREQLRYLIEEMGYEAILSEDGDIYYSPDLHTHISCLREVRNCDMVVLIIGNRFGSEFVLSKEKSVTQMEHDTAYISTIPIFSFIDEQTMNDYKTYRNVLQQAERDEENPDELLSRIPFGSCTDTRIFKFIDDIRMKTTNNAYFPFRNFRDIKEALKKQWAGMISDFLRQRKEESKNKEIIDLLSQIEVAGNKVENIVELVANATLEDEEDKDRLKVIGSDANERRLGLVLFEIWDCVDLNPRFLSKAKKLKEEEIGKLYAILFKAIEPIHSFQSFAHKKGMISKGDYFIDYRFTFRVDELRETAERYKVGKETATRVIKNSLIAALERAKED